MRIEINNDLGHYFFTCTIIELMKKLKILLVLFIFLLASCKTNSNYDGPYRVERVVDGDTFITTIDGQRVRVRALCIDTPESVAPEETGKENTDEGILASNRAKQLLEGQDVYLEYDVEKYDQYDRVLAYVYLQDNRCFEEIMISEGLAKVVKYEPNYKHVEEYYKLQDKAREDKVGLYATGFYK